MRSLTTLAALSGLLISVLSVPLRAQSNYTPYAITTLAGSAGLQGSTDGAGSAARFRTPTGLGVDGAGNVYLADGENQTIRKITPTGVVSTLAGSVGVVGSTDGPAATARFNIPFGVAVDFAGNVFVTDTYNHTVRKITPARTVSTLAGLAGMFGVTDGANSTARFTYPLGLALDSAGNLYVADYGGNIIRKVTPAGVVSTLAGGANLPGSTDGPVGSARFNKPYGIAVDSAGTVYVSDHDNNTIRKISGGMVSTLAGVASTTGGSADGIGGAARFNGPQGMSVDAAGNLYVADNSNNTIRRVTSTGVVSTLAGVPLVQGSADGLGSTAKFYSPFGAAVDGAGRLYIADNGNETIRVGVPTNGGPVPGVTIPRLVPAGASTIETRALAEQPGGRVLVAVSGAYTILPSGGSASALTIPDYTNPQPYNLSYVVRLLANGQPDPTFTSAPGGDGTINAFAVQPDGKIVVAGTFTKFNGVLFKNLGRLKADGTADTTFNSGTGPDAQVNALAIQPDGAILVGGTFLNFQGLSRPYLVRVNSTGAPDTTFAPALNGVVNTISLQLDGKILVGGNFTTVGGTARARIARLLPTGAIDPTFDPGAGANGEVVTLLQQPNGAIVAGGEFTTFAGQSRSRIVRLLAAGGIDPTFSAAASTNDTVIALGLEGGGSLLLGGTFTQVNGVTRNRLARLLVDGAIDPTFDPGAGANKDVRAILPRNDGTVFVGGLFDQYQGTSVNEVVSLTGTFAVTVFLQAPRTITVSPGGTANFYADVTGLALSYQWSKDGVAIAGATSATLTLTNVAASAQGRYTLQVTSSTGTVISADANLVVTAGSPGQIINLSVLTSLDAPTDAFTLGFTIGGTGTSGAKALLVRAAGPSLVQFGVGNALTDPKLQFFAGGTLAGENDNWGGTAALSGLITQVGAFPYTATNSKDAAFAPPNLTTTSNSVVVSGVGGVTGAVIAEVYDATPAASVTAATPRLINVSVLKPIASGATLTAGFVIGGSTAKTVLIRAVGPTLSTFGVGGPLADPKLTLNQSGVAEPIATNDNWGGSATIKAAMSAVGAFALDPLSKDAALLITLQPGSYTAQANGVGALAGSALVEVYEVP